MFRLTRNAALPLAVCVCSAGALTQEPGFWRIGIVDPNVPNTVAGNLAFFPDGRPAVSYAEVNGDTILRYAEHDGGAWQISNLASGQFADNALAILPAGPAVAYGTRFQWDVPTSLICLARVGGTWQATTLDSQIIHRDSCSLVAQPGTGLPAIAEGSSLLGWAYLVYYAFDGNVWQRQDVASRYNNNITSSTYQCSLAFLSGGDPAILCIWHGAYPGDFGYELRRITHLSGGGWENTLLENTRENWFVGVSGAVLCDGNAVASYADPNGVKYWENGSTTVTESHSPNTSLVVLPTGEPAIAFYPGGVEYAWRAAGTWRTMVVDPDAVPAGAGALVSMALRPTTGQPAIAYYDSAAHSLRLALAFFRGDLNCDGYVNFDDINAFVVALTDPAGYAQQYPACDMLNGDLNGDGRVDAGDINPFVALLSGG